MRLASLFLLAIAAALPGCAETRPPLAGGEGTSARSALTAVRPGLEIVWWSAADDATRVAAALEPYAQRPVPMDDVTRAMLSHCGIRIVTVPAEDLARLATALGIGGDERPQAAQDAAPSLPAPGVGGMRRSWMDQGPHWHEAFRGPVMPRTRLVGLHDGAAPLPAGALRLIARCWLVPVMPGREEAAGGESFVAAALRVELVPQLLDGRGVANDDPLTPQRSLPTAPAEGLLLSRLAARLDLRPGTACVLMFAVPG